MKKRKEKMRKDNKSGYLGVSWNKLNNKWHAQISINKKKISLGYYSSKEVASTAFNNAVIKYNLEDRYKPKLPELERKRIYRNKNLSKIRSYFNKYHANLRNKIIEIYGSKCNCCGENNSHFLSIDHIDGKGFLYKKTIKSNLYVWLQKNNFPKDNFQLLCYNCNCGKKNRKVCPHKDDYKANRPSTFRLKMDIINNYGGCCQCCGERRFAFLTIDHINNDGAKHRKELGFNSSYWFYKWLQNNNYPKENLQLLCYNCNLGKRKLGYCPHEKNK